MANGTSTPTSPVKDAIDANSGRFEFLKQTLTLGSAGIAGVAALFTDPTRVPADTFSKWAIFGGAVGLALVVAFAIMGLSAYANLLAVNASENAEMRKRAPLYANGVRDHARVVILGLTIGFLGIGLFAGYRLFFAPATGTPENAIEAAAALVSKETKQDRDVLYLTQMEADSDAYTVTYFATAINSDITVRVSKKDGKITRLTQDKRAPKP
jgi:hypothetical protein